MKNEATYVQLAELTGKIIANFNLVTVSERKF